MKITPDIIDLIQLIQQQQDLLQQLMDHLPQGFRANSLGFGPAPSSPIVYCNRTQCPPYLWYRRVNAENQGIEQGSLTGYLRKLAYVSTERRGKETRKLHATIEAEQNWILECSESSIFAKGLLSAVAALSPIQLQQYPIQIVPVAGEDEKVLFCQVWIEGTPVEAGQWNSETDFQPIAEIAFQHVNQATDLGMQPARVALEPAIPVPQLPANTLTQAERVRQAREAVGMDHELIKGVLIREYHVKHPDQLTPAACDELVEWIHSHAAANAELIRF